LPTYAPHPKSLKKLTLKHIMDIQNENKCDLTGVNQQGIKQKRSTSTFSLQLQSLFARALNKGKFVLVSSFDLSSAFDIVNISLLIKRLKMSCQVT
jgi:hypothetical protein